MPRRPEGSGKTAPATEDGPAEADAEPVVDAGQAVDGEPAAETGDAAAPPGELMPNAAVGIAGPGAALRRIRGPAVAWLVSVAAAILVVAGAVAVGLVDGSNGILTALGFDPDRAQLITALIVGGTTSVVTYLAGGIRPGAIAAGFVAIVALFGATFVTETQNAMAATGALGSFDAVGWTITLLSFVVIGFLTAWACAVCAQPVRRELIAGAVATVEAAKRRPIDRGSWSRPLATLLVLGLLALTLPIAGDLFNYGADSRMIHGGPRRQGLVPDDQGIPVPITSTSPTAAPSPSPSAIGAISSPSPTPPPTPGPSATPIPPPWLRSVPTRSTWESSISQSPRPTRTCGKPPKSSASRCGTT